MQPNSTTLLDRTCRECGTGFTSPVWEVKRGSGNFCSRHCARIWQARQQFTTAETRFWENVEKSSDEGCWLWTANTTSYGYGRFRFQGQEAQAHRVAWKLVNGPIPKGMYVCHNCPGGDVRSCVNPAHLFLGTHADNMSDMVRKGRSPSGKYHWSHLHSEKIVRGKRHGRARLTDTEVAEIRALYASGALRQCQLARRFQVAHSTIHMIISGKTWQSLSAITHVTDQSSK